jgi:hypothetical protein
LMKDGVCRGESLGERTTPLYNRSVTAGKKSAEVAASETE